MLKATTGPLAVEDGVTVFGLHGERFLQIIDQTPARHVIGAMLPGDAEEYVALRNAAFRTGEGHSFAYQGGEMDTAGAPRETEVRGALTRLNASVGSLAKTYDELSNRLETVMSPAKPADPENAAKPGLTGVLLADEIGKLENQIAFLTEKIRGHIGRLEI